MPRLTGLVVGLLLTPALMGGYHTAAATILDIAPVVNPPAPQTNIVVSVGDFLLPGVSAYSAFAQAIQACRVQQCATLSIPPGRYVFDDPAIAAQGPFSSHISISGLSDVTIDGHGAEIVFHFPNQGIRIFQSQRLLIRNFSIDYDFRIAAPGTVLREADGTNSILLPGDYPVDPSTPFGQRPAAGNAVPLDVLAVSRFDASTLTWTKSAVETGNSTATLIRPQTLWSQNFWPFDPGDQVVVRFYARSQHAFGVGTGASDISVENIVVYSAPGGAFIVSGAGRGFRFSRCVVVRKPEPTRVISSTGGGIHVGDTLGDIIIEDSDFSGMGDDSINIHGKWLTVSGISGNTLTLTGFLDEIDVGAELKFVRSADLSEYARARVAAVLGQSSDGIHTFYVITLTAGLPGGIAVGDRAANLTRSNPVFVVRRNVFHHHRARGLIIQSPNGLVESNLIKDVTMACMHLTTDGYFDDGAHEGPGVENVTVRGNVCEGTNYGSTGIYAQGPNMAAINLLADVPHAIDAYPVHRNVVIEGNTIYDTPVLAILVASSDGVAVRDNTIIRSNQIPSSFYRTGEDIDAAAHGSIMITRASNVTVTGNLQVLSDDMFDSGIYVDPRNTSNILVQGNSTARISITVTPGTISFGSVGVGGLAAQKVTVGNIGTANLVLGAITVGGTNPDQFKKPAPKDLCSGQTLGPTQTCTVLVRFKPTNAGSQSATVLIPSNDPVSSLITVTLGGFGVSLSAFVAGFYQDVLGREPDPAGTTYWVGSLRGNCNASGFNAIGVSFYDSPEFRTRPLTLNGLVTSLYRAFLDRDPEAGGLGYWAQRFRNERVVLANDGFISSAEFQTLLPDRTNRAAVTAVVTRFYQEILGREPEPAGLTYWVNYIVTTQDLEGAAVSFITSSEFEAESLTFRDYVTILYRTFLGRNPDAPGLDFWEGELRQHLLGVIQADFVPSAEFQGNILLLCGS